MAFTVQDFRDLIRLLEQHPEWRAELRRWVLGEEVLTLPQTMRELADIQRRTEARLEQLTAHVDELAQRLGQLTMRVDELTQRLDRLTERVDELAQRLEQLTARVDELAQRLEQLTERVDELTQRLEQLTMRVDTLVDVQLRMAPIWSASRAAISKASTANGATPIAAVCCGAPMSSPAMN